MAVTITSNKKNSSAVIHVAAANATLIVAGNNSVSNVAISDEILTGANITQAIWGCDGNGHIQVLRGANLVAVYDSTSFIDYAGSGMSLTKDAAANITINFVGSANAYIMFEVQKVGRGSSEYLVG